MTQKKHDSKKDAQEVLCTKLDLIPDEFVFIASSHMKTGYFAEQVLIKLREQGIPVAHVMPEGKSQS